MSPKIDISCFSLRAINFDNARELDAVAELINTNLSQSEFLEFKSKFFESEEENLKLVSVLVAYDHDPIAHVAFDLDTETKEVTVFAPVIDKKFEHLRHFVNSMVWRTLARLSRRQNWKKINFSSVCYGDIPSIDCAEFRAIIADILPGSAAASLRDQIEVVHGEMEIVNVNEEKFSQMLLNLP